jgi:hypothetical protein
MLLEIQSLIAIGGYIFCHIPEDRFEKEVVCYFFLWNASKHVKNGPNKVPNFIWMQKKVTPKVFYQNARNF